MSGLTEHSEMSRKVREYFQRLENTKKLRVIQVAEIAGIINRDFAVEKLTAAETRWNEVFKRQDFSSQDHKELELDACRSSYEFWKQVAELKGCKNV